MAGFRSNGIRIGSGPTFNPSANLDAAGELFMGIANRIDTRAKNKAINEILGVAPTEGNGETSVGQTPLQFQQQQQNAFAGVEGIDPLQAIGLATQQSAPYFTQQANQQQQSNADRLFGLNQDKFNAVQDQNDITNAYKDTNLLESIRHNQLVENQETVDSGTGQRYGYNPKTGKYDEPIGSPTPGKGNYRTIGGLRDPNGNISTAVYDDNTQKVVKWLPEDGFSSSGTGSERIAAKKADSRTAIREGINLGISGVDQVGAGYDELLLDPEKYGLTEQDLPNLIKERSKYLSELRAKESDLYSDLGADNAERKANREAQKAVKTTDSLIKFNDEVQKDVLAGVYKTGPIDSRVQRLAEIGLPVDKFTTYTPDEISNFLIRETQLSNRVVERIKEISGAAATDLERANLYEIITGGANADEATLIQRLGAWSQEVINSRKDNVSAQLNPVSSYELGNRSLPTGGTTSNSTNKSGGLDGDY